MSKISSIFGGGGVSSNPSTLEIFTALRQKKLDADAALLGETNLEKSEKKRREKAARLKGGRRRTLGAGAPGGDDEEDLIRRHGARRAKLLGN